MNGTKLINKYFKLMLNKINILNKSTVYEKKYLDSAWKTL